MKNTRWGSTIASVKEKTIIVTKEGYKNTVTEIKTEKGFYVTEDFVNSFDIDDSSISFMELMKDNEKIPTAKELIEWIEEGLREKLKCNRKEKYWLKPINECINKVLPKLKQFDLEKEIVIS